MRVNKYIFFVIFLIIIIPIALQMQSQDVVTKDNSKNTKQIDKNTGAFTLKSNMIEEGKMLSGSSVGCNGESIMPALSWDNAPATTKSFAITVFDPDAPTQSGWWHFVAFNISHKTKKLSFQKALPKGTVILRNDRGDERFGGACPPKGEMHRYIFTIYALDEKRLNLTKISSNAMASFYFEKHAIAKSKITTVYKR